MRAISAMPRIAIVGPIAEPGKSAGGGFAAGNRRTIDQLRKEGIEVIEFAYPEISGSLLYKSAAYGLRFAEIAGRLVRTRRDWDILHITPLLRHFIAAEMLLCRIPKKLGKSLFLDLRAGTLIRGYHERGRAYRRALARLIGEATTVAVEGEQYTEFVRQWTNSKIFYFPNYVVWQTAYSSPGNRRPVQSNHLHLVTLGRIVPEKGIEVAIELVAKAQTSGIRATLDIIGTGDAAYIAQLKARCRSLPVHLTGPLPPHQIVERLSLSHFFIFPTTHRGEGHSNALTEAMALGVVPICSDNGFNAAVVGGAGAILPKTAAAPEYLRVIRNIMNNGSWSTLSKCAADRVKRHYCHLVVLPNLINFYQHTHQLSMPTYLNG
jgi:glycosyltransferase involved in cell wall biosynthesis